jgi:hypothetical protein
MTASPAGWFPDPGNPQNVRWWDGQQWTQYTQPAQPVAQPVAPSTPQPTGQPDFQAPAQPGFQQGYPQNYQAAAQPVFAQQAPAGYAGTGPARAVAAKPVYQKWWFWCLIVVALIAVGVPIGNALSNRDDSEPTTTTSAPPATGQPTTEAPATAAPATEAPSSQAPTSEAPAVIDEPPVTSGNPAFGQTYTWPDGTTVSVSIDGEFTPGDYSAGAVDGWTNLIFSITVENHTGATWNTITFSSSVLSGGRAGSSVYDFDNDIGLSAIDVPDGKSVTWEEGYSVADPGDLAMTVELDWSDWETDRDKVTFVL